MLEWMVWTTPVAVFFGCIALLLAGMTVWELKSPTVLRKGFLPIATTRGDRLFIGLLSAAYVNLAFIGLAGKFAQWFSLEQEPSIWFGFVLTTMTVNNAFHGKRPMLTVIDSLHWLGALLIMGLIVGWKGQ